VTKQAGLFGFGGPVSSNVPGSDDLTMPDVPGGPRRRRPPPPPSWLASLQQKLWGSPDAIVPEMIESYENQEKTGRVKRADADPMAGPTPLPMNSAYRQPFKVNPSPTAAAVKQISAPTRPPFPTGRAAPASAQVSNVLAGNRPAANMLAADLHGLRPRSALTAASRAQGYPAEPWAAPASTVQLLQKMYPHQLPPTKLEPAHTGVAEYRQQTGQTTVSDPLPLIRPGMPNAYPAGEPDQQLIDRGMPNRLGLIRHETEHGLQDQATGPSVTINSKAPREDTVKRLANYIRASRDWSNSKEIPASLGDLPYIAQAHKLETGRPLNAPVTVAPDITHNADWMARQAQQHGMFGGNKTTTELLATQAGQAYLRRLLAAQPVIGSVSEEHEAEKMLGDAPGIRGFEKRNAITKLARLCRIKTRTI
jgi:hypothetical protein